MSRRSNTPETPRFASGASSFEPYSRAAAEAQLVAAQRESAKRRRRRWLVAILIMLVAAVAAACVWAGWSAWMRADDTRDFQGVWHSSDGVQMAITAHEMQLPGGVGYSYSLDTFNKTVSYSFQGHEGAASYRFGSGRDVLVIDESGEQDRMATLGLVSDAEMALTPAGEGVTVLTRVK